MLNTVYQLVRPRQFEVVFKDITMDDKHVIVHPTHLSICNADQRYYQGLRAEAVLKKKLPMALIHEGIGRVIYDPTGHFEQGTLVVMIPNTPVEQDEIIAENYLRSSKFRASGFDRFYAGICEHGTGSAGCFAGRYQPFSCGVYRDCQCQLSCYPEISSLFS